MKGLAILAALGATVASGAPANVTERLELTNAVNGTDAIACKPLPAPTNVEVQFWKNDLLSTRRVPAYEFASSWDAVTGAKSYTVCYTQKCVFTAECLHFQPLGKFMRAPRISDTRRS